ncbi:unnamed protein product [Mycena citricolor]|uniref:FAD dependent oxidoreductase domain-containing protein n=1 Tax=Mycena citricolor TaxID=2018698 RepID=A0AAD2H6I0_9AGAR|nr:unnamed protein product [Mycena citricolor]
MNDIKAGIELSDNIHSPLDLTNPLSTTMQRPVVNELLSTATQPLVRPSANAKTILVVGAGVIGLSTAWALLDRGFKVKIAALDFPSHDGKRITSLISGALWEYPPAVCGHHGGGSANSDDARRSMISYHFFHNLSQDAVNAKQFGVKMRRTVFFFKTPVLSDPAQVEKRANIRVSGVIGFDHPLADETGRNELLREFDVPMEYVDAYTLSSPVIDTDSALMSMLKLVRIKGAEIIHLDQPISFLPLVDGKPMELDPSQDGKAFADGKDLCVQYNVDAVVNATGLGSKDSVGDKEVYGLQGAVIRLENDWKKFHQLQEALVVSATESDPFKETKFIFIVPRNDNTAILGGFTKPLLKDEKEEYYEVEHEEIINLRERCNHFMRGAHDLNGIHNGEMNSGYPLAQGTRPGRAEVCLERNGRLVHNFGCADSLCSLSPSRWCVRTDGHEPDMRGAAGVCRSGVHWRQSATSRMRVGCRISICAQRAVPSVKEQNPVEASTTFLQVSH